MRKRINQIFNFIRQGRDGCKDTEEFGLFFVATLITGIGSIVAIILIGVRCYTWPMAMIPFIVGMICAWKGDKL